MQEDRNAIRFGLKQKLILAFSLFALLIGLILSGSSLGLFSQKLREKNLLYVSDITYQTTNSVKMYTQEMEDITFSVLSSSVVQENLRLLNSGELTGAESVLAAKRIEDIILIHTLYNDDIISLSVISNDGREIIGHSLGLHDSKSMFSREALYQANGSALWGLIPDDDKDFCVARAILDLKTQKPIGYVNLVFRQAYIGRIMNDISISYENGSYLLDGEGQILSSNLPERIGFRLEFPDRKETTSGVPELMVAGTPSYIYEGPKMYNDWTMVTVIPKNELSQEIISLLTVNIVVDFLVIAAAVLTIWALIRRLMAPIDRLCGNMKEVGQGNFEKREIIETNDEISLLSRSYNEMVDNIESLIDHVYKLEISNRQAELEFLKMQINPHFLYNTLDTISWMARSEHKDDIADITVALASLLRNNIKQDSRIPIRMELENIRNYLLIQKVRFGEKLDWSLIVEPQCEECHIPSFILQPLVENAIIHGLEPKQGKGKLVLSVKEADGFIDFVVADNGIGMDGKLLRRLREEIDNQSDRTCIGLKNASRRLQLYYEGQSALHIESDTRIGTRITFRIPVSKCQA